MLYPRFLGQTTSIYLKGPLWHFIHPGVYATGAKERRPLSSGYPLTIWLNPTKFRRWLHKLIPKKTTRFSTSIAQVPFHRVWLRFPKISQKRSTIAPCRHSLVNKKLITNKTRQWNSPTTWTLALTIWLKTWKKIWSTASHLPYPSISTQCKYVTRVSPI